MLINDLKKHMTKQSHTFTIWPFIIQNVLIDAYLFEDTKQLVADNEVIYKGLKIIRK